MSFQCDLEQICLQVFFSGVQLQVGCQECNRAKCCEVASLAVKPNSCVELVHSMVSVSACCGRAAAQTCRHSRCNPLSNIWRLESRGHLSSFAQVWPAFKTSLCWAICLERGCSQATHLFCKQHDSACRSRPARSGLCYSCCKSGCDCAVSPRRGRAGRASLCSATGTGAASAWPPADPAPHTQCAAGLFGQHPCRPRSQAGPPAPVCGCGCGCHSPLSRGQPCRG